MDETNVSGIQRDLNAYMRNKIMEAFADFKQDTKTEISYVEAVKALQHTISRLENVKIKI